MSDKLFVLHEEKAEKMKSTEFKSESDLQRIIALNPNLLAREWSGEEERDLFLVKREQPTQVSEDASNSFSLDHLLVDEDGIPVLVEVKRSSDTRIRREVVAQMLDYACRATAWNSENLQKSFMKNNPGLVDDPRFDESFWNDVSANLKAERMRLVFAADQIPDTLRILIEFMDRAMKNIEVYGVELKQYKSGDVDLLAKSLVGNSFLANPKPATTKKRWEEDSVPAFLQSVYGEWASDFFYQIKKEMLAIGYEGKYGNDRKYASLRFYYNGNRVFSITANEHRGSFAFNTNAIENYSRVSFYRRLRGIEPSVMTYNDENRVYAILRLDDSYASEEKRKTLMGLFAEIKPTGNENAPDSENATVLPSDN